MSQIATDLLSFRQRKSLLAKLRLGAKSTQSVTRYINAVATGSEFPVHGLTIAVFTDIENEGNGRRGAKMGGFHSKFGGLWIDSLDREWVNCKLSTISDPALRQDVRTFIDKGYVVLNDAVSSSRIDAYLEEYEASADMPEFLQIAAPDGRKSFSRAESLKPGSRVLDTGMLLPSGEELSFAPKISAFLETIFEEKSLAFQTLHFEVGSTQDVHQDTAFVVIKQEPLKLIASWIALEDIESGSGELIYYPGGHRIKEYSYANGTSKHWFSERDGHEAHQAHYRHLQDEAARLGLALARFAPKKGDALLWHAELPHGGGEITIPGRSRRSLVTHYCPKSLEPVYWDFIPADWRNKVEARGGNAFTSYYFPPTQFAGGKQQPGWRVRIAS